MKKKLKILVLGLIGFISVGMAEDDTDKNNDKIIKTQFYKNIAISKAQYGSGHKISINNIINKPTSNDKSFINSSLPVREVGLPIWSITTEQLPVTKNDCLMEDAGECTKKKLALYNGACYNPCILYGPEFLAFDENTNKIYFFTKTTMLGNAGGPVFFFVGDINKKEIKYLGIQWYHTEGFKGSLSPSGRYLALYGPSLITVYDTKTNTNSVTNHSENVYGRGKGMRHYLDVSRWLSDTQFSYLDGGYEHIPGESERFSNAKEVIYDISKQTSLRERPISEKEYESTLQKQILSQ